MNILTINEEQVTFAGEAGALRGVLTLPDVEAPHPAIVLLHGSDRAGAEHAYYVEHARKLVLSQFAVLRYDGPGWGGSSTTGPGFETLEQRTEEAIAAIQYLQSRPDIKSDAVGLWGISQGGWICQMAAATHPGDVAFIVCVSGPGVTPVEQEVYRVEMESKAAGFAPDEVARAVLMRRLLADIVLKTARYRALNLDESVRLGDGPWQRLIEVAYVPNGTDPATELGIILETLSGIAQERWAHALHLEQVLPMLKGLPPQAWEMAKAQMRAVLDVQPRDYLTQVRCPLLAIFGGRDRSLPVEKSVSLYGQYLREAGNETVTLEVFPDAGHTLRNNDLFTPGYFELMLNWLRKLSIAEAWRS